MQIYILLSIKSKPIHASAGVQMPASQRDLVKPPKGMDVASHSSRAQEPWVFMLPWITPLLGLASGGQSAEEKSSSCDKGL